MALNDDLKAAVMQRLMENWRVRNTVSVPTTSALGLGNDALRLEATVLYADLADSTALVDLHDPHFAAVVYKVYLHCAGRIIRARGGAITAYDGDRIMAVFTGPRMCTDAALAALQINWARSQIINPALQEKYPGENYQVQHTIGIDTSMLFVALEGVRGANDLVWVGRAANYAAKLSALSSATPTWITEEVFARLDPALRTHDGQAIWQPATWAKSAATPVLNSAWRWPPDLTP
jgi:class 3 adenylate cyclase